MVTEQVRHTMKEQWNGFAFGWDDTANKAVNKRGAEEHVDE